MDNKMYTKQVFKCGICGKEYENVTDRAKCELNCYQKQQEEIKKAAEEKKKAEQAARKKEVDEAFDKATELRNVYLRDYGEYSYEYKNIHNNLNDDERFFVIPKSWYNILM